MTTQSLRDWLTLPSLGLVRSVRPSQIEMALAVEDILANGGLAFLEAGTGTGKCHARGQGILLHSGKIVPVEDVKAGARLMGPDGTFRTVLQTNCGRGRMVDVVPVKGERWRVNDEHILTVVMTDTNEVVDVSIKDYLQWSDKRQTHAKLLRAPATFAPHADPLLVDPYILGLLLGDGCMSGDPKRGIAFTSADSELVTAMHIHMKSLKMRLVVQRVTNECATFRLAGTQWHKNKLTEALNTYGLLGANSHTKFIPDAYKRAEEWVRLAMLAGLMDTDGHLNASCGFDYISASSQLAADVVFLARSVGLAAYVRPCEKRCQTGGGGTYHRVSISGDTDRIPCKVPRKQAPARRQIKSVLRTGFHLELVKEPEDFFGFTLDGDGRYLLGDFTVTHNSFAYGLPAVMSGKRVVISTATKGLQEQLANNDMPLLSRLAGPFSHALMKGKSNYSCALRWEEFRAGTAYGSLPKHEIEPFDAWVKDGGGDLGGWTAPWVHNARVAECVKNHCPHAGSCSYVGAKFKAQGAKIIVVNHALLAHDLALGGGKLFGKYEALILDEGHKAPKFFRDAFSLLLSPRQPEHIGRLLKDTDFEMGEVFGRLYDAIFTALPPRGGELKPDDQMRRYFVELYALAKRVHEAMGARGLLEPEGEEPAAMGGSASIAARERAKVQSAGAMLGKVRQLCEVVLEVGVDASDWIQYSEKRDTGEKSITVTPLEIGPLIAPALLGIGRVVVTSATLSTSNGMGYMAREFGLSERQIRVQKSLPSPFNYPKQSALYISKTAPDPATRGDAYYDKMVDEIHELLTASRGGAFVLCASRDDMETLHNKVYRKYHPLPYRLGMQGAGSVEATMRWFKEDQTSVLMGLQSYWEGVDVPGNNLRLVIIPRLPFPNRGDVVLTARKRRFVEELMENTDADEKTASIRAWDAFDFQEACMHFKQGGGRVIRTETDKGIVAVLDRRALGREKAYSPKIRALLPHPESTDKGGILKVLTFWATEALARPT